LRSWACRWPPTRPRPARTTSPPRASCWATASTGCHACGAIVGDRAYRGLARLAERKRVVLDIKARPAGTTGFVPIRPLYKIEHAFAQLGRWRRLSRCYEGSAASARAWLEVASVGYLAWRAVA
jgi:hypothetical protein